MAHNGYGSLAFYRGELQTAFTEYRRALQIWPSVNEPSEQALTNCDLGQLLLTVGLSEEALKYYEQARKLSQVESRRDVLGMVYDGLGLAYHDLDKLDKALWAYENGLRVAQDQEDRARTLQRRGNVYRDQGKMTLARQGLEEAASTARRAGSLRWEAFSLADLAHLEDVQGRESEALRLFDEAYRLLESVPEPLAQASMLFGRAEVLRDLGRYEDALASLKRSIDLVEASRTGLEDVGARVGFFSFRQKYYDLYVTLFMELYRRDRDVSRAVKAFEISDLSHSRSLLDDFGREEGSRLQEIQRKLLDKETTLLSYSLGERGSYLWVVNPDRIDAFDLKKGRNVIEGLAAETWRELSSDRNRGWKARELALAILPAAAEPLLRKRLLVRADGALHQIPFAALPSTRGELIDRHIISYVPSASYQVEMRRNLSGRQPAPKQLALLTDAVFNRDDRRLNGVKIDSRSQSRGLVGELDYGSLSRLPDTADEADAILKLVPPSDRFLAIGFEANRATAMDPSLSLYQILHISTHHIYNDHPDFSGLVLSRYDHRGVLQEGLLRASEIYKLKFPAELVVLSACGSGLGPRVRGEGPMGMTRAFLHAGAKRVVVSLWNVRDDWTKELMERFYHQMLVEKLPPSEALRAAQLSLRGERSSQLSLPKAWAAFLLQGEPY